VESRGGVIAALLRREIITRKREKAAAAPRNKFGGPVIIARSQEVALRRRRGKRDGIMARSEHLRANGGEKRPRPLARRTSSLFRQSCIFHLGEYVAPHFRQETSYRPLLNHAGLPFTPVTPARELAAATRHAPLRDALPGRDRAICVRSIRWGGGEKEKRASESPSAPTLSRETEGTRRERSKNG